MSVLGFGGILVLFADGVLLQTRDWTNKSQGNW